VEAKYDPASGTEAAESIGKGRGDGTEPAQKRGRSRLAPTNPVASFVEWVETKPPRRKVVLWLALGVVSLVLLLVVVLRGNSLTIGTEGLAIGGDLERRVTELESAKKELEVVLRRDYVRVKDLPVQLQGGDPESVIRSIGELSAKIAMVESDITHSVRLVAAVVKSQKLINLRGDASKDVRGMLVNREIQRVMSALGHHDGALNGDVEATRNAVEQFQRTNKLKVDGRVGKDTWGKVAELIETQ
jgi:hypothetical protein